MYCDFHLLIVVCRLMNLYLVTVWVTVLCTADRNMLLCANVSVRILTLHGEKLASPMSGLSLGRVNLVAVAVIVCPIVLAMRVGLSLVPVANATAMYFLPDGASPLSDVAPSMEPGTITLPLPCLCIIARCYATLPIMLVAFVIDIRLFGRTIPLSTSLKFETMPVMALPRFSDMVTLLMLSVATSAAGSTLNIGRSMTDVVSTYISMCTTPTNTDVSGTLA